MEPPRLFNFREIYLVYHKAEGFAATPFIPATRLFGTREDLF